jgi:hypothetical protein
VTLKSVDMYLPTNIHTRFVDFSLTFSAVIGLQNLQKLDFKVQYENFAPLKPNILLEVWRSNQSKTKICPKTFRPKTFLSENFLPENEFLNIGNSQD